MSKSQASLYGVILCVGVLYGLSAPAYILGGDSAEFVTLAATGGVAHPPGYPLYVLWLRLWHALFGGWLAPAHLAALASVPLGLLAVTFLYKAARAHGASAQAAVLGALVFALTPIAWRLNTQPEVFAPHVCLCSLLVWLCAKDGPLTGLRRIAAVSLVGGATLSVHHTAVLVGPTVLYGLVAGVREAPSMRVVPLIIVCGALGLSPYLTLLAYPTQDGPAFVWHAITGMSDLVDHFLRREYGTFQLSPHAETPHPLAQMGAFFSRVGREVAVLPVLLALLAWRRVRGADKLTLLASFLLSGPIFAALLNIPPYGPGQLFVPRFYMLPLWFVCLWAALGADMLGRFLRPATLALAAMLVWLGLPQVRDEHRPTVEYWLRNALAALPDDAVVLVEGDHRAFALEYAQRVEHKKPDVLAIRINVLPRERDRVERALGTQIVTDDLNGDVLMQRLKTISRPVFVTLGIATDLAAGHQLVPRMPFFELVKEAPPSLEALTAWNRAAFHAFRLEPPSLDDSPTWSNLTLFDYSEAWIWLAKRWQARGDEQQMFSCLEEINMLAPWLAETAVEKVARKR